jgi:hypothetical protein
VIVPVVEGLSEVDAVPELLRRLLWADEVWDIPIARPFRVKRHKVIKLGELERAIQLAASDRPGAEAVLVIIDADDDDPGQLENDLLGRALATTALPVAVIAATKEYECWLLGAKESLRGSCGIRIDAIAPENPEGIRDGKSHLSQNMDGDRRYVQVEDQAALTAQLDLDQAEASCASFSRLRVEVRRIVAELQAARP